jgi:hypothetical protein
MARAGYIQVRRSEDDLARWQAAADAEGMTLSAWLRRAADRAAEAERRGKVQE